MSDSDDDWGADFDEAVPSEKSKPTIVLSGIGPNPDAEEDWGDDFDDVEEAPSSPHAHVGSYLQGQWQGCYCRISLFFTGFALLVVDPRLTRFVRHCSRAKCPQPSP